jgi:hypothetical protein
VTRTLLPFTTARHDSTRSVCRLGFVQVPFGPPTRILQLNCRKTGIPLFDPQPRVGPAGQDQQRGYTATWIRKHMAVRTNLGSDWRASFLTRHSITYFKRRICSWEHREASLPFIICYESWGPVSKSQFGIESSSLPRRSPLVSYASGLKRSSYRGVYMSTVCCRTRVSTSFSATMSRRRCSAPGQFRSCLNWPPGLQSSGRGSIPAARPACLACRYQSYSIRKSPLHASRARYKGCSRRR